MSGLSISVLSREKPVESSFHYLFIATPSPTRLSGWSNNPRELNDEIG